MELYHDPTSRSARVRMALEELRIAYKVRRVSLASGEHKSASHMRLHPLGQLPVLVDGDTILFESVAICMYLGDRYPGRGLAPALDRPERAAYLQWCTFVPGSLEPAILAAFVQARGGSAPSGLPSLEQVLRAIATPVERHGYLLPCGFSMADVLLGTTLAVIARHGVSLPAALATYLAQLSSRASFEVAHT